jgi:hypothetical protein
MDIRRIALFITALPAIVFVFAPAARAADGPSTSASPYAAWSNGPSKDPSWFPIGVWLQNPKNALEYKKAGINLYIALWKGPTGTQLSELTAAGMPVICDQNSVGLAHKDDAVIVGWTEMDEPDNAQSLGKGKGYGPPVLPEKIIERYEEMRKADPTRPVLLNLGQSVADDANIGRGTRTNHPEDYAEYVKGCDIASFDIYPVASKTHGTQDNLDFVALGADRLAHWAAPRPTWTCIECTGINSGVKPTPREIKAEVWMALTHGSMGLIWFVHEFKPKFKEAALLEDPETLAAVTAINKEIIDLAPALNAPTLSDAVTVESTDAVPVAAMAKEAGGARYVFAVAMKPGETKARFAVKGLGPRATVDVIGEGRSIEATDGKFEDEFRDWDVHLYRVKQTGDRSPETGEKAK